MKGSEKTGLYRVSLEAKPVGWSRSTVEGDRGLELHLNIAKFEKLRVVVPEEVGLRVMDRGEGIGGTVVTLWTEEGGAYTLKAFVGSILELTRTSKGEHGLVYIGN